MIDLASLYFDECYVKHYEFDEVKRQISIQLDELSIVKPGESYNFETDQPIIDAIIRFYGVSEYCHEPNDKEPNDWIDEITIESGRFVIYCGFVDANAISEDIRISFLAENVEIVTDGGVL